MNLEKDKDYVLPFTFEERPIRGKLISLGDAYRDLIKDKNYPLQIKKLLAEIAVMAVYFGSALKNNGSIAIQLQTEGLIKLLVVECRSNLEIRGIAKYSEGGTKNDIQADLISKEDLASAKLAVTIFSEESDKTYQSLVPFSSPNLIEAFLTYIVQSDQIETAIEIQYIDDAVLGVFLQKMPDSREIDLLDDKGIPFEVKDLIPEIQDLNFREQSSSDLLLSMFHAHEIRVFNSAPISMRCNCDRKKVEDLILVLGKDDALNLIKEEKSIKVTCEMCGAVQEFDEIDVLTIFDKRVTKDVPSLKTTKH